MFKVSITACNHPRLRSLIIYQHGLQADPIAQSHLTRLRVGPDSTTTILAMAPPDPWSLSQDGDFFATKGLLYVPDNQEVDGHPFAPPWDIV